MKTRWIVLAMAVGLLSFGPQVSAEIKVTQHASGAVWPLSEATVNVAGGRSSPDDFQAGVLVRPGGVASQTFTVCENFTLSRIDLAYSTLNKFGNVQLRLQEADPQLNEDQTAYVYDRRKNLFATPDLSFNYNREHRQPGVLSLEFAGADQVKLEAGKTYAIEFIHLGVGERGFLLRRRGASTYGGGAVFLNRSSINGTDTRDAGMRIFSVEKPGSSTPEASGVPAARPVDASPTVMNAKPRTTAPAPVLMDDGKGLILELADYENDPAVWKFFNGAEFPGASGSLAMINDVEGHDGDALKLIGDFRRGGAYVAVTKDLIMPAEYDLARIRLRYMSKQVKELTVRLGDGSGQIHQQKGVCLINDGQWHDLVLNVPDIVGGEHWAGANDGHWHGPAKLLSINMGTFSYDNSEAEELTLYLADIRAEALDAVTLEGNDTQRAGTTVLQAQPAQSVSRGDYGFKLTYRWQSQPTKRDYRVFMHIVDAEGKTVYNDDHEPPIPTSEWDGLIEYTRDVCLPRWLPKDSQTLDALPEGEYTLYAGLCNTLGRKPLKAGDSVMAGEERRYQVGRLMIDNDTPIPPLGPRTLDLTGYEITFSEEFDQPLRVSEWGPITNDGARWIAHTPYKGDFGDARFAAPRDGFPFLAQDGILRIEARKEGNRWYSGLISSMDTRGNGFTQQYGYFEMRARFPATPGTWPGFWLHESERVTHPDDKSRLIVEIDTIEQYGHWPNKHTSALHVWDRSGQERGSHRGLRTLVPDMTEDYHTYGQMVTRQFIIYYYDGIEIRREPTPDSLDSPLYMVAELAMGPGWPLDRTPSPVYMDIDYIRVYGTK